MISLNPSKDWDWDKETQSLILMKLDEISCNFINANREKGKPKVRPEKKWQPDYVTEAKEQLEKERTKERRLSEEQIQAMKQFWKNHNPEANFME